MYEIGIPLQDLVRHRIGILPISCATGRKSMVIPVGLVYGDG